MKKKLSKATAAVLVLSFVLSGCGGDNRTENITEIHWYMPKVLESVTGQADVEREVNKYIEPSTGYRVRLHLVDSGSYVEKTNVMLSSGEELDIVHMTANEYQKNVRRGALTDVTDLMEQYGQDILAKTDPLSIEAATVEGRLYAIPSQNPFVNTKVYVFKKEFVEKYGLDYKSIKNLDDLEPYLQTIKENEPGITPILAGDIGVVQDTPFNGYTEVTPGIWFDNESETFISAFDMPEMITYLKKIKSFYDKGYIAADAVAKGSGIDEIKSGNYAVMMSSGAYSVDGSKSSNAYGFSCVETLIGYEDTTTGAVLAAMNIISSTSKNPEGAMKVLNAIWKDPYLSNTLAYGLEGKDYTVVSEGDEKSVLPKSGKEQTWCEWHNIIGPLWDQWDSTWNSKESLLTMQENNKHANASKLIGFLMDTEPIKNEVAQINAVYNSAKPIFGTGSMPDFDEYLANVNKKLEDAGIDRVIAEITRQYEEWKETKQ